VRDRIVALMREIAADSGNELDANLRGDSVLLESGLDSMGFAILVARLEEELGYDPFVLMDEPVYPRTLDEFAGIYERFKPKK